MLGNFGRYQLVKKLATGGMGQVFLARQKGPVGFEKLVVVKQILPHLSEEQEFIEMFFDEARIAAHLNHSNIAQIYDLGEIDDTFYIAMEYVHGESLRALNQTADRESGGLPLALKCRILSDAAAGLDFAHRAKSPSGRPLTLIHRDVSPQNVLVGFNGAVKLIDFGIAKAAGKISTTMTGAIKGKYAYMSPEQARGEALDHRSDVFGLGIVFYEVLTSSRLFKRANENETMKAVVGSKITPPSELVKGIPRDIDAIVARALARKREDRYQSAGEFQLALENFLVQKRLPGTTAHLAGFMRELYREQLADENSAAEPTDVGAPKISAKEASVSKSRSGKKSEGFSSLPPAIEPPSDSFQAGLKRGLSELEPDERVSGFFFNALLAAVLKFAGPIAEPAVRAASRGTRTYSERSPYAAAEFLKILHKAAQVIAPVCHGELGALTELGSYCFDAFHAVEHFAAGDRRALAETILIAMARSFPIASADLTNRDSELTFAMHRQVLPEQFLVGFWRRAFARLSDGKPVVTSRRGKQRWILTAPAE